MVVQLVVGTEALALRTASDTARDEEFLRRHVLPDTLQGLLISLVASEGSHVGNARVEIAGTHGVAHNLILPEDGHVVLRILAGLVPVSTTTCLIDKILGAFEVLLVARHLIELAERHLDDGMPARTVDLPLVGAEGLADEVCVLDGHVEEGLLARRTIVGNGALDQVA